MKKVKFLQDFQGVETKNVFFPNNFVAELDDDTASRLVKDGRAEYAEGHGTASFGNTPQFEEVPAYVETVSANVDYSNEEIPVMTSKKFKRGK